MTGEVEKLTAGGWETSRTSLEPNHGSEQGNQKKSKSIWDEWFDKKEDPNWDGWFDKKSGE